MPTLRAYRSEREYEAAWERLTNSLKPGDLVFTANRRNVVSRLIAWLDHGVWAHVATHIGDGRLVEALPEGVVERDISSYKDIKIHVGVYRDPNLERTGVQRLIETVRHKVGAGYDYRGALKLGFIKLLLRVIYGDRAFYVTVAGDPQLTPNDLIYSGRFALVDYL